MPEGDTIYRIAVRLRPILEQQRIAHVTARDSRLAVDTVTGQIVASIEPRGKHLLIHLANGHAVHSHLGMTGSWHVYSIGETWLKPASYAALTLSTERAVCVCFSPKTLELLSPDALRRHAHLHRLGPDVLADDFDGEQALVRFRVRDDLPIGEAIMDQTILCGVGNIYKSETLFKCRLNPFRPVSSLTDGELRGLIVAARRLMRANRTGHDRRTRFQHDGDRFWAYGRSGQPCLHCGQRICMRHQGTLGRSTYWCPGCQPAAQGQ
jgi:endonuclease-8